MPEQSLPLCATRRRAGQRCVSDGSVVLPMCINCGHCLPAPAETARPATPCACRWDDAATGMTRINSMRPCKLHADWAQAAVQLATKALPRPIETVRREEWGRCEAACLAQLDPDPDGKSFNAGVRACVEGLRQLPTSPRPAEAEKTDLDVDWAEFSRKASSIEASIHALPIPPGIRGDMLHTVSKMRVATSNIVDWARRHSSPRPGAAHVCKPPAAETAMGDHFRCPVCTVTWMLMSGSWEYESGPPPGYTVPEHAADSSGQAELVAGTRVRSVALPHREGAVEEVEVRTIVAVKWDDGGCSNHCRGALAALGSSASGNEQKGKAT